MSDLARRASNTAAGAWTSIAAETVLLLLLLLLLLQITKLEVEAGPGLTCSAADNVLSLL
jgi:hypothetical protein